MRGRNECGSRFATLLDAGGKIQTFLVNRHGHGMTTAQCKDFSRQAVTGLFHPHTITRIEQDPSRNLKRVLRTCDDHDLLGFAVPRPRGFQIAGDGFAKHQGTHWIAVIECTRVYTSATARDQVGPCVDGKLVECHLPYTKCSPTLQPGEASNTGKDRTATRDRARSRKGWRVGAAGGLARRQLVRKGTGNDGSCTHAALEIAFGKQLGVRIENGKARNANFGGKHSGRRNSLPWPEAATDNCRAIGVINLPMKSLRGLPADRDHRENPGSYPLHFLGS